MQSVREAETPEDISAVRMLLREYAAYLNHALGEQHICLESYDRELAGLPGLYAAPRGAILLATVEGEVAGCVAMKPLKPNRAKDEGEVNCEMKRLWVRPPFRGRSIGLALAEELIAHSRRQGYTAMYLDTVPAAMRSANAIYRRLGFAPAEQYDSNPVLGANPSVAVEFFRLSLT